MPDPIRTVRVADRDGDTVRIVGSGPKGDIEVIATMTREGDVLVLRGLHADGSGPGALGLAEVRAFARLLGDREAAGVVEIHGGTRTTGARPGKVPRPIRVAVGKPIRESP